MAGEEEDEKVRLFVGQVPRSMTAEQPLAVLRAAARADGATVIGDRNTGASRGCCFVVRPSREEADKAIAYHNKWTLPGGSNVTSVVKLADKEKERQARKAQKAQSQTSNFLRAYLDPQH